MLKKFGAFLFPVTGILILGVIYSLTFPETVQSGDTGELVANSYFLRVLHPPGYPLFNLIYHGFLNAFPVGTIFGKAAILTIGISLLYLGLLMWSFPTLAGFLVTLVTGTSLIFWKYAVLPDVFSLHLLFLTVVFLAFDRPERINRTWFVFLVSLGIAHHHTILFAFPLYAYSLLKLKSRRALLWSLVAGLTSLSLYFLQMFYHPEDMFSWGALTDFPSITAHFLRKEYGTFSLSVWKNQEAKWIFYFCEILITNFWGLFICAGWLIYQKKNVLSWKSKSILILACAFVYLFVFLVAGSISLNLSGQIIFERFLLQPLLFFALMLLLELREHLVPQWIYLILILNAISNVVVNWSENNFRTKTSIEDYTINILQSLPSGSVYYAYGDTEVFSAYYVKEILKIRSDVIILPAVGMTAWGEKKIIRHHPDILKKDGQDLLSRIDLTKRELYSNRLFPLIPKGISVSSYGLVYRYYLSGDPMNKYECEVAKSYSWRNPPNLRDHRYFDYGHYLFTKNGSCYYDKGVDALKKGFIQEALTAFEEGLLLSPFNVRNLDGLCRTYGMLGDSRKKTCEERLESLISEENQQYYLFKF